MVFWHSRFNINQSYAICFYKITPWQKHFYACGHIFAVRHIWQRYVEILKCIQDIGIGCFNDVVHHSTCFRFKCEYME